MGLKHGAASYTTRQQNELLLGTKVYVTLNAKSSAQFLGFLLLAAGNILVSPALGGRIVKRLSGGRGRFAPDKAKPTLSDAKPGCFVGRQDRPARPVFSVARLAPVIVVLIFR